MSKYMPHVNIRFMLHFDIIITLVACQDDYVVAKKLLKYNVYIAYALHKCILHVSGRFVQRIFG